MKSLFLGLMIIGSFTTTSFVQADVEFDRDTAGNAIDGAALLGIGCLALGGSNCGKWAAAGAIGGVVKDQLVDKSHKNDAYYIDEGHGTTSSTVTYRTIPSIRHSFKKPNGTQSMTYEDYYSNQYSHNNTELVCRDYIFYTNAGKVYKTACQFDPTRNSMSFVNSSQDVSSTRNDHMVTDNTRDGGKVREFGKEEPTNIYNRGNRKSGNRNSGVHKISSTSSTRKIHVINY